MELEQEDFLRLYKYIQKCYGIDLSKKKKLIESRLGGSVVSSGYSNFHDYVDMIVSGKNNDVTIRVVNKLTTNYTYFLREIEHFDFLQNVILPELEKKHQRDRVLSIWSAGCSSGQEPYTISMYLKEYFEKKGDWDLRILASDISQNILSTATNPQYPADSLKEVPPAWKQKYFRQLPDGDFTVSPDLRRNVIFKTFNLMDPIRWKRKFDLIFCRNVMIYFDQPTKDALVQRFYDYTVPEGYLFIGHSEGLTKNNNPYTYIKPAIYQRQS